MSTRHAQLRVTVFSTGSEFRPISNFTELHTLTQAARSHTLDCSRRVVVVERGKVGGGGGES